MTEPRRVDLHTNYVTGTMELEIVNAVRITKTSAKKVTLELAGTSVTLREGDTASLHLPVRIYKP